MLELVSLSSIQTVNFQQRIRSMYIINSLQVYIETKWIVFIIMACVCGGYNVRSDWLLLGNYFLVNYAHGPIMGLQKQSKMPYNKT